MTESINRNGIAGFSPWGREDGVVDLENFPETLLKLFNSENFGKLASQVAPE